MSDDDGRLLAAWFLGGLLVVEAMRSLFSYSGYMLTQVVRVRLGIPQAEQASSSLTLFVLLGLGLVVAAELTLLAVRKYRAPRSLWLAALTASVLQLASLAAALFWIWLAGAPAPAMSDAYSRVVMGMPFVSAPLYFAAAIGYPLAAWLGCWLGAARLAAQSDAAAPSAEPQSHA